MMPSSHNEVALEPPSGVVPNLVDPASQAYVVIIVTTLGLCLATPVVMIRLYTRHFINHKLWWDDGASACHDVPLLRSRC